MTYLTWIILAAAAGAILGALTVALITIAGQQSHERRGGTLDLTGTKLADPDDWFTPAQPGTLSRR